MKKLIPIAISLVLAASSPAAEREPGLELHFIDVGHGDAILLKSPSGQFSLIDAGSPRVEERLSRYLAGRGVGKLEYFIVTHPHPDHLGNAAAVLKKFGAGYLRDNGRKIDRFDETLTRELAAEYEREFREQENYRVLRAGQSISWDGVTLDVLWPRDPAAGDWNTSSLVILLRYGKFRALLAGDFNTAGEEILLKEGGTDLRADLLKTGHHGAADASGEAFIRAVSPKIAVVSVGDNPWGYPDEENLRRLEEGGVRLYRTDRDGTVVLEAGRDGSVRALR